MRTASRPLWASISRIKYRVAARWSRMASVVARVRGERSFAPCAPTKAAQAQAIAERVVLPRPEGTSENSRGQRPWKTTAPHWSSPDGARQRRVGPAGFARSYRACPRTVLRSRGVAPGYFRLPFQGSVGRKTGYPVGETDNCAQRHLFWNLDMHPWPLALLFGWSGWRCWLDRRRRRRKGWRCSRWRSLGRQGLARNHL